MRKSVRMLPALVLTAAMSASAWPPAGAPPLDAAAQRWVDRTLAGLTLDEKLGQLVMPGLDSTYLSTDSDRFERARQFVERVHAGGFVVFGGKEPVPGDLLNPGQTSVVLGAPLALASTLNRLQRLARVPLLNGADFEFGAGMRIKGATAFPHAMAFGAANDPALLEETSRATAREMRALGVHVNFAPVADVNNNPRNPVINIRSFGEDPARVGALVAAAVRGLESGGVLATLKHFPGHGDTAVDTHLGLATIPHDRARLQATELTPFDAGIRAGAAAVMVGHLEVPAIEPARGIPATLSAAIVSGLLRTDLGFDGLVMTDSLSMEAVSRMAPPGEVAVRALEAGNDVVLDPPDPEAALDGLRAAAASGRLPQARIDASVRRVLGAKARLGLTQMRTVDLERVPDAVGTRANRELAVRAASRALTLVRDEHGSVPLAAPRTATVLVLSLLDYAANWRFGAPGRTFVPELRQRWPATTAIELTDRSDADALDLVRAMAPRFDAIVIATYVRSASGSGRMDLPPPLARLLDDLDRGVPPATPIAACLFGNPYVATALPARPALLLTFDFGDAAELAAVRALAGESAVGGRLPIALDPIASIGAGLVRPGS